MHVAVANGHISTVKILLDSKIEALRQPTNNGVGALDVALNKGDAKIFNLLLNENFHYHGTVNFADYVKVIQQDYLGIFKIFIRHGFHTHLNDIDFLTKIVMCLVSDIEITKATLILNYIFCHYEKSSFTPEQHHRAIQMALGESEDFDTDEPNEILAQIIRDWKVPEWSPELHLCFPEAIQNVINQLLVIFSKSSLPKEVQFLIFKQIAKSYYEDKKGWHSKSQLNKALKRLRKEYDIELECLQNTNDDLQLQVSKLTKLLLEKTPNS